jgi:hypothetical protein
MKKAISSCEKGLNQEHLDYEEEPPPHTTVMSPPYLAHNTREMKLSKSLRVG